MAGIIGGVEVNVSMMTARTARRLWNDTFREQGQEHADNVLPLHFEWGAYQRYNYARRSGRYTKWKFNRYGHRNPNVKSGALRLVILATASAGVTATHAGWTVKARGTQQHRMWGQTKNELEQISPSEEERYARQSAHNFVKNAGSSEYQFRKRKVIRK